MTTSLFRDPQLDRAFARDGYVIIDLLDEREVQSLGAALAEIMPASPALNDPQGAGYTSYFDVERRECASEMILETLAGKLESLFHDYRALFSTVFWKPPHGPVTPLHQHPLYISDYRAPTVGCWCPLVDCTDGIGAFQIVPRSHGLTRSIQNPTAPSVWSDFADVLASEYLTTLGIAAGKAVLFDDSIPHGATANGRDTDRMAVLTTMAPANPVPVLALSDPEGAVEIYETPNVFGYSDWFNGRLGDLRGLRKCESVTDAHENVNQEEYCRRLARRGVYPRRHWRNRLSRFLARRLAGPTR